MLQSHKLTPGLITCFLVSCCLRNASHFSLSTVEWHPAEEDIFNEKLMLSWSAAHPRRHSTNWTAISSGVDCDGTGAAGLWLHEEAVRCMAWRHIELIGKPHLRISGCRSQTLSAHWMLYLPAVLSVPPLFHMIHTASCLFGLCA